MAEYDFDNWMPISFASCLSARLGVPAPIVPLSLSFDSTGIETKEHAKNNAKTGK